MKLFVNKKNEKTPPVLHRQNQILFWLLLILAIAFAGLRDPHSVGNDSRVYNRFFEMTLLLDGVDLSEDVNFEKGFVVWNNFCATFLDYDSSQMFFVLTAIFSVGSVFLFFHRYSDSILASFLFFFFLRYFDWHLSAMRQVMAIGFILFAYHYTIKRNPLKYIAAVTLAALFQSTAITFAPFYLINFIKLPRLNGLKFVALAACFSILIKPLSSLVNIVCQKIPMFNSYLNYVDGELAHTTGTGTMILLMQFSLLLFLAVIYADKKQMSEEELREQNIFMYASITGMVALAIATLVPQFERATWYFTIPICVLLPNVLLKVKKYLLLVVVMIFLLASYLTVHFYRGAEWVGIYPYTFFWNSQGEEYSGI